jgi:uncharacterized protein YihD (DUF1040 family)
MRDPARINEIAEVLQAVWSKCPDQRLGQLILNAASYLADERVKPQVDIWDLEDGDLLEGLLLFDSSLDGRQPREPWPTRAWVNQKNTDNRDRRQRLLKEWKQVRP